MMTLLAFGTVLQAQAQLSASRAFVMSDTTAYMMLPPEVASGATSTQLLWSDSGDYLAIQRDTINLTAATATLLLDAPAPGAVPRRSDVIVYNRVTRTPKRVLSIPGTDATISEITWIGTSNSLLITVNRSAEAQRITDLYFSTANGPAKLIDTRTNGWFLIAAPPARDIGAFYGWDESNTIFPLQVIDGTGKIRSVPLPWAPAILQWRTNKLHMLQQLLPTAYSDGTARSQQRTTTYDPKTDKLVQNDPADDPLLVIPPPASLTEFQTEGSSVLPLSVADKPKTMGIIPRDAKEGNEVGVLTTDGEIMAIAPKLKAVAFTTQGVTLVRDLIAVDKQLVLKAREAAQRMEAMSRAKQVALGFLLFSSDNDDVLPANSGWQDAIAPYLRNSDLMKGFNFVLNGDNLAAVERPAETMLGFVDCPGGRAIAYIDGHVRFVPNPK